MITLLKKINPDYIEYMFVTNYYDYNIMIIKYNKIIYNILTYSTP